ncbi:MAG TPA: lysylphosphatidylglycerol synthase transmembrane domain-containing protein [Patescibacteria group bacterium]
MFKKLLESKMLRFAFSAVLVYFAFRKVDVLNIVKELGTVPAWFVAAMVAYFFIVTFVGAWRWCLLLFEKPSLRDVLNFTKAGYYGAFYSIFFPTGVAGDLLKWLPLQKNYPEMGKTRLLSSVLLDRVIGFTAFILVAFVSAVLGKIMHYQFPGYLVYLFGALFLGVVILYVVIFTFDVHTLLSRIPLVNKLVYTVDLLKSENKNRLFKVLLVSFFSEFTWITPVWFTSLIFKAGFSLLSVYVFLPVITMILVLPISVAGFGARENLYLLFFSQLGIADERILLVSTFSGIITIFNALIGGIWSMASGLLKDKENLK